MNVKTCSRCREKFQCEGNLSCWCQELPHIVKIDNDEDCICPKCLEIIIAKKNS